jgi:uncharacterized protein YaeQ
MALPSTVFKAELQISDMDRNYYQTNVVTLARHPSETDERMMMRVLAFAMNASENLSFANGLTANDEPDLWQKDFSGTILLWIMVGLPDEKQIKKACSRSEEVIIYCYGTGVEVWWSGLNAAKFNNLSVFCIPPSVSQALAHSVERSMKIQCTIQDGMLWWSSKEASIDIEFSVLKKTRI